MLDGTHADRGVGGNDMGAAQESRLATGAVDPRDGGYEAVEFQADGVTLRGRLYGAVSSARPSPAVVMSPGFATTVAGMMHDRYAAAFASAGLITLIYDHFGWGASDGEPRHEVEEWRQARSYIAAVTHLSSRAEVDPQRIAVWGNSMSGRLALAAAATDDRVAALVVQMPGWGDEPGVVDDPTAFSTFRETLLDADLDGFARSITGPMPVVSPDQLTMPSFAIPITAFRWFIEFGAVFGTGWENRATWVSLDTSVPLDARICAPHVDVPTMVVTALVDEMPQTDSDVARGLLSRVRGPTESLILDGGHFGALYPGNEQFVRAVEAETAFLTRHLAARRGHGD